MSDQRNEKAIVAVGNTIQKGRLSKNLTQRDLALKINEKQQIIKDLEAGRGVLNQPILVKIERVIGLKLRGKDIGKPLILKVADDIK